MPVTPDVLYPPNARCGLWLAHGGDWTGWRLDHADVEAGAVVLTDTSDAAGSRELDPDLSSTEAPVSPAGTPVSAASATGPDRRQGSATSPEIDTHYPFTNLVASWNADAPTGSHLEVQVRARIGERWTGWYILGRWSGSGTGASAGDQQDADGHVEVDTLMLNHPATGCQMRVLLNGEAKSSPRLTLASVCWYNPDAPKPAPPAVSGDWARILPVPRFSQMIQKHPEAGSICSPTSLAMVLDYCGVSCTPLEAVSGVHDTAADMYGNWPLNTAYAGARGCPAYVARFWSLEQIQNEIARGRPVEASIRFGRGELLGAPISSSNGHLVVVVGFTPAGNVVVNDPAARDEKSVQRVYLRRQFEKVWQEGSGGIVYLIEPPVHSTSG